MIIVHFIIKHPVFVQIQHACQLEAPDIIRRIAFANAYIRIITGYSFSDQHTFCHQLTKNKTTDFVRFTNICTNCAEIPNTSLNFRTICVNLHNSDKIIALWVNC